MRSSNRFSLLAAAIVMLSVATASADNIIFNNGGPNQLDGNEVTAWIQTEDFELSSDALLTDAHFWTGEFPGSWDGTLDWYLFNDVGGIPAGAPFASGSGVNVSKVATGNLVAGFLDEYAYSFDLDSPVGLAGGTTYWFGLHLADDFDRHEVYWETTNGGFGQQGSTGEESLGGTFDNWFNNGNQHAFYLTSVPEPSSFALIGFAAVGLVAAWRRSR